MPATHYVVVPDLVVPDLQMFTGLCYALLGSDGKVSKSVHLALNEPKSVPILWTGFSRGSG